jgi:UDP-N-acetyl-D-galactosamine dehydrogenase
MNANTTIAVVGLGYVGLPLAVEFGKRYRTIGFDLSTAKVDAYRKFNDPTGEVPPEELRAAKGLVPTTDPAALREATSSSWPCPRRSTTRTSRISRRCSARARRWAAT